MHFEFKRAGMAVATMLAICLPAHSAESAGHFFAPDQESASAVIAADAHGGLHAAHTGYDGPAKDIVYYRHCSSGCTDPLAWHTAELPVPGAIKVQLALTPAGAPRLMISSFSDGLGTTRGYYFAECDSDCSDAGNWAIGKVAASGEGLLDGLFMYTIPERSFALDEHGNPLFVIADANYLVEPDHYGAFLIACTANCTEGSNWTETNLALHNEMPYRMEQFGQPVLATAPGGMIAVLASIHALDPGTLEEAPYAVYYLACREGCDDRRNWVRTKVIDPGFGSYPNPSWDLVLSPEGQPRAAFFAGERMEQKDLDHLLIYMWCDASCESEANWYGNVVGPAVGDGESPDLAINGRGQPRIAFVTEDDGLGVVWCDDNCQSNDGKWTAERVEASAVAAAARPTALPFHCDGEIWSGFMPALALSGDTPWFTYDLTVNGRCLYKDFQEPIPTAVFNEIWRGSRVVTLP